MSSTTITFYSTTPPEESKSKYPKQSRTSYTIPSGSEGNTSISFNTTTTTGNHPRAPQRITGFVPLKKRSSVATAHRVMPSASEASESSEASETSDTAARTRSGRVSRAPHRYEPVENVCDDYAENDYDSDESED
jgi:hypothetical protein